ncbi:PilZ domain-containing protein [Verrucomicrobiota bacterium]
MRERRRIPRLKKRLKTVVSVETENGAGQPRPFNASTVDASAGGVRMTCGRETAAGVRVELFVSDARSVKSFSLSGRVAWTRREQDGRFTLGVDVGDTRKDILLSWNRWLQEEGLQW